MIASTAQENVTGILGSWREGDDEAAQHLVPLIYDELRSLARNYLRRERSDHTLQATGLVHEAYLKLVDQTRTNFHDRAHFFALAAQVMRRVLVDHARKHRAEKRGGQLEEVIFMEELTRAPEASVDLLALNDALNDLAKLDPRQSQVVELRFFGGLAVEEVAEVLHISARTVKREWRWAKAWLRRRILLGENHGSAGVATP